LKHGSQTAYALEHPAVWSFHFCHANQQLRNLTRYDTL
jgi:hypothetical protein